jgi:hypothetical protein
MVSAIDDQLRQLEAGLRHLQVELPRLANLASDLLAARAKEQALLEAERRSTDNKPSRSPDQLPLT